ncbi:MAG: 5-(carboxyamino)imidazole ribonucleotide synthase [bacterium]|nr:5-(carboxyamino)imidazole ribonucleotide synthase [bacterium]
MNPSHQTPQPGALLPGSTLGVLGGGQLGRMFALAAHRLGFRVAVYSDDAAPPASLVVDRHVRAPYDDLDQVAKFAASVDAVTFEFENVPTATAQAATRHAPVRPSGDLLHMTQHRLREKRGLRRLGLPVADFAEISSPSDFEGAAAAIPGKGIMKTAAWGYDGKGQRRLANADEIEPAWRELGEQPTVLEAIVPFEREISVVGARGVDGEIALYEPFENLHENQILDTTLWPARVSAATRAAAHEITRTLLDGMAVVGVLCIEMFVLPSGELIVNEIAPRPHNSGHLTIDAHVASQFEQQARAVAGLPLGAVDAVAPAAAMVNLLGDLWQNGEPDWAAALREPGVRLHLYGKAEARPGRKMGHLTVMGDSDAVAERAQRVRSLLPR